MILNAGSDDIAQESLSGRPLNEIIVERPLPLAELADLRHFKRSTDSGVLPPAAGGLPGSSTTMLHCLALPAALLLVAILGWRVLTTGGLPIPSKSALQWAWRMRRVGHRKAG